MDYKKAVVTSAPPGVWYEDLLFESIEVTADPLLYDDPYSNVPSEHDLFALKESYIVNSEKENGIKTYKAIRRGCLQFQQATSMDFEF